MEQVYANRDQYGSVMEEKFQLTKVSDTVLKGKYPLQPFEEGQRGTYGGEFISQATLAAWETIDNEEFSVHSLHAYFLKAGSEKSVMRYEVETNSSGKNYINKSVKVFQDHSNELVFILNCSFTRNNNIHDRKVQYANHETKRIPYEFQKDPHEFFADLKDKVKEGDGILEMTHTHDLVTHGLPLSYLQVDEEEYKTTATGDRKMGFFVKINDKLPENNMKQKINVSNLLYLSDSVYLGCITRSLGVPLAHKNTSFFRVSLDHSVFIHDNDFNSTEWLFLDYTFPRMSNERVLCNCSVFDLNGKLIASINQEALINLDKGLLDRTIGGTYKL
ncbi:peroxisomal acyl-coenzyme A thioester hydrolase 1 [[Candida] jaroonii]|uniref:Peroxisomal acyl-coenzyme A thioester hydrolase 1 n=1 Tax=[Candida] jaroonii TaxID=467808 RepID=A0ACA9Y0Y7_9ASCO|nr:peroxisomal acyl-coenzyme A thioester hydrolase 1 [[Candida] jaroonii]